MKNILFVTWDGPQTSYLESLFLPIFSQLKKYGYQFYILQFTWADEEKILEQNKACEDLGFSYRSVKIWRKPVSLGALLTSLKGLHDIRKAIDDFSIDIVMPRSTQPALSTLLALRKYSDVKFIFDADGLPLDERIDFTGQSPTSLILRFLRDVERQAVIKSDHVITRSQAAIDILQARAGAGIDTNKFTVVTNGRDERLFNIVSNEQRHLIRSQLGISDDDILLVYAGSLGEQYCIEEMFSILELMKEKTAQVKFLILTGSPDIILNKLTKYTHLRPLIILKSVSSDDVPNYLSVADLGLALRRPSFSMQGVAPIKLSEYLLCGLPVIATKEIGDTRFINDSIGYLCYKMDNEELNKAVDWFFTTYKVKRFSNNNIRNIALKKFSLHESAKRYKMALEHI